MEELGFSSDKKSFERGIDSNNVGSFSKSAILPEIRNSRKNGKAFKPVAFSIYSIMKPN